jgi:hypothetical protein
MKIRLFAIFALIFLLSSVPARAQGDFPAQEWEVQYNYGENVLFRARFDAPAAIKEASIFFHSEGEVTTHVAPATIQPDGWIVFEHQIARAALRPFARVDFWYQLTLENGETVTTSPLSFDYIDNRFPWQLLEDDILRVHWYAGDLAFGQQAFDVAHVGLQNIQGMLSTTLSSPVDIYIYASGPDLQSALGVNNNPLLAGQASLDLNVIFVSVAPGAEQGLEMDRQIPHELAHALTYEMMKDRYPRLPMWFREGISSVAELAPNSDYSVVLSQAVEKETIIPMSDLCNTFPPDMGGTYQAYAQSSSFTRFLVDEYGPAGLLSLASAYGDGLTCEQGTVRALGASLSDLETSWRRDVLGENPTLTAFQNLLPYIVLFVMVLVGPVWNAFAVKSDKR